MNARHVFLIAGMFWLASCTSTSDNTEVSSSESGAEPAASTSSSKDTSALSLEQPGVPVVRQLPWEPGEVPTYIADSRELPLGTLRFEEPGCLVWTHGETGVEYALLAMPQVTYHDGQMLTWEAEGEWRSLDLPASYVGENADRASTARSLEASGVIDPDTPIAELCPGRDRWVTPVVRG